MLDNRQIGQQVQDLFRQQRLQHILDRYPAITHANRVGPSHPVAAIESISARDGQAGNLVVNADRRVLPQHATRSDGQLAKVRTGHPTDWFEHVKDRAGHDLRYAIDSSKLRRELGWEPAYSDLREGLTQTIEWYRANEAWWKPHKDTTEQMYRTLGH